MLMHISAFVILQNSVQCFWNNPPGKEFEKTETFTSAGLWKKKPATLISYRNASSWTLPVHDITDTVKLTWVNIHVFLVNILSLFSLCSF